MVGVILLMVKTTLESLSFFLASSICDSAFLPSSCYVILEDKIYTTEPMQ